jgi:hypothetical protein
MLSRSVARLGGRGLPVHEWYVKGVPKRTWPMRDGPKHPAFAPGPGGWWVGKHWMGWPLHAPFELYFYRVPFSLTALLIVYDLAFGLPAWVFLNKEKMPGTSSHFFFGNNGGIPHHFWQYQDGFYVPNHSGVPRMIP